MSAAGRCARWPDARSAWRSRCSRARSATATFTVTAIGIPPLSYQWWYGEVSLADGGAVQGASTAALTLSNVQPAQAGNYWVVVMAQAQ